MKYRLTTNKKECVHTQHHKIEHVEQIKGFVCEKYEKKTLKNFLQESISARR